MIDKRTANCEKHAIGPAVSLGTHPQRNSCSAERMSPAKLFNTPDTRSKHVASLRKAEYVLQHRTEGIMLVLERCTDYQN
jgi:hypothetical protein